MVKVTVSALDVLTEAIQTKASTIKEKRRLFFPDMDRYTLPGSVLVGVIDVDVGSELRTIRSANIDPKMERAHFICF